MKAFWISFGISLVLTLFILAMVQQEQNHRTKTTQLLNSFTAMQVAREGKTDREWYITHPQERGT